LTKAGLVALLGGAVACAIGAWWISADEERPTPPAARSLDDLELVAALLDGAPSEPPRDLLVAGPDELYLARASDRTVVVIAKEGGASRTLTRLDAPAHGMALAGAALWITTGHGVEKVPVVGGEPQHVASGLARPRAVASDGRWVFVVDVDPARQGMTRASAVARIPASGGERTVVGRSEGEIPGLVLDSTALYWADRLEGSIVTVPVTGGEPRVLATDRGLPDALAVEGDAITWVEKRSESLWTMPKTGGSPRRLAQDFAGFANVVVDGRGVFWTNEAAVDGAFRVLTVSDAGEPTPVSRDVDGVDALASDGARLFWDIDGAVSVVARP
jgi:hypothetical protein